jgi:hypothetical protein
MAALPVAPLPTSPQTAPLSEGERIVNTFVAPSKTFTDIRRSAMWWAPYLLTVIAWLAFVYVGGEKVGFRKAMENQMQNQPKQQAAIEQLPPAEREQRLEGGAKFTKVIWNVFPILQLVVLLLVTAISFGLIKVAGGSDLTFKASLATVMYAQLPGVLKLILAIIALLVGTNPDSFTFENPVGTNLAYFLGSDMRFLKAFGGFLDIFLIWTLILCALGFTYVSKVKRGASFAIVFGVWLFFALALSSLALLG